MSFLQNAKIITKVLAPLVFLSVIAIASILYLSWNYRTADERYSDFIASDNRATLLLSRANTSLHTAAYVAYKVLAYDQQSPQMAQQFPSGSSWVMPISSWQVGSTSGTMNLWIVRRLLVLGSPSVSGEASASVIFLFG